MSVEDEARRLDRLVIDTLNKPRNQVTGEDYFKALKIAFEAYKKTPQPTSLSIQSTVTNYRKNLDPVKVFEMYKERKKYSSLTISYHEQYEGGVIYLDDAEQYSIGRGNAFSMLSKGFREGSLIDADFQQMLVQRLDDVTFICGGKEDIIGIYLPS